ncbi:MAG: excinuclease ABC subunit A [Candidatus Paceibacteria bacterium]|jgi:excinuclease ABC subunit A
MSSTKDAARPKSARWKGTSAGGKVVVDRIRVRGARQNNLQNIDVDVPRGQLVAVTGVSGSGKSSLAFDTLYREGQRRFLETLSAYARQFLGRMEKPEVDHVEGLSPAIAVDQKAVQRGPRSTVGTITEVIDHMRVLFARAGVARCPDHGEPLEAQTPEAVVQRVLETFGDDKLHLLAPLIRDRKGQHKALFEELSRKGYVRARVNGEVLRIEDVPELARYKRHSIEVVVDRLKGATENVSRLREAIDSALELGAGDLIVVGGEEEVRYSTSRTCPVCSLEAPPLEPRLFSFNSPHGACEPCAGLGHLRRPSVRLLIADTSLSIREGCLGVTRASGGALLFPRVDFDFLERMGESRGFDLDTPWKDLSGPAKRVILYGAGAERFHDEMKWGGKRHRGSVAWQRRFGGVMPALERAWRKGQRKKYVERFLEDEVCPDCEGSRLNRFASAVTFGDATFGQLASTPVGDLGALLDRLKPEKRAARIAESLLQEIHRRLGFLREVGLTYLSMDRAADTLSGGEAQRIRLAAQLGAGLQGVLYVLDEPSIGLHARDHGRLFRALQALRDGGNTVVVVEHDEATLRQADWLIDIGPGAGRHGGKVVAQGPPSEVAKGDSPTGQLLRGELEMPAPETRRTGNGDSLVIRGARGFNLKGVDVSIPLGTLTAVTGVSGSGKSTVVNHTLARAVTRHLGREAPAPVEHDGIDGMECVDELVVVDASPIGRTPRSNPATYAGAFTPIRDLFSSLPEARVRGWLPGRFSFNVAGGRCEACQGAGSTLVELQFLAPVTVPCEDCGGHRFQPETLDVTYRERSIADVLALTIEEAADLFRDHPKIARPLDALVEVGVGYLTLGQPSTTISGGEAQRVKLAKHLQKRSRKHTLYLLDEPTTGLHQADVQRLVGALQSLVDQNNTVLVIEHDLDVVRAADYVVDLGPEAGEGGGTVVATGTPEDIEAHKASHTGVALARERKARVDHLVATGLPEELRSAPQDKLVVVGAKTHNLKNITVSIPRESMTVVTGPSGSGKSSLALDTIHAAGRQRFVESLSTYARQFLSSKDRPPVERIDGLGPSVAVEARTSMGHPRSTIATTTELHDHMRVLFSRAGVRRCPAHGQKLERCDPGKLTRKLLSGHEGETGWLVAPVFGSGVSTTADDAAELVKKHLEHWRGAGYVRVLVDGTELRLDGEVEVSKEVERVDLVIDRLALSKSDRARIAEAIESAAGIAQGRVSFVERKKGGGGQRAEYSTHGACTECGFHLVEELEPRHFSFNAHVGACPRCVGLGLLWTCDPELLIDSPGHPLVATSSGAPTAITSKLGRYLTKGKGYYEHLLRAVATEHKIDLRRAFGSFTPAQQGLLLFGKGARANYAVEINKEGKTFEMHDSFKAEWPGLCGHVDAWHAKSEDPEWCAILEKSMSERTCPGCEGERLAPGPRAVTVARKRLPEVLSLAVDQARAWVSALKLPAGRSEAVEPVVEELESRLSLLEKVGLGYLTLDRAMSTLSGGEARRVRLSASLGSQLVGVCYVLDEPTVGLHPGDVDRLTDALLELRDGGNTVLVVEHDESLMRRADYIVDMGPGAGRLGGTVVAAGTPAEIEGTKESLTGQALRGELRLEGWVGAQAGPNAAPNIGPVESRRGGGVLLTGAKEHNLKGVEFGAQFGQLTGVCGPSGSGKSTLVLDCLVPALRGERPAGRWKSIKGGDGLRLVVVDASPIGRTPASVPATAVGLLDPLRDLFARTPDARIRGYRASHFSFNSTKGRCPACDGRGATKVDMQFLADLWLTCEECDGRRYRPEVLEVRYRNHSIADVLAMTVDEALALLKDVPAAARALRTLADVGLGYLCLGQSSTTLSSGEAQRVKLATELLRAGGVVQSVVILDEPTTGLHKSDVRHLYGVLRRLVERGDAVIVIEHHVDLLNACDRLVELGPGGGAEGGRVIAAGTPVELRSDADSITGPWLAAELAPARPKPRGAKAKPKKAAGGKAVEKAAQVASSKPSRKVSKKVLSKAVEKTAKRTGKKTKA